MTVDGVRFDAQGPRDPGRQQGTARSERWLQELERAWLREWPTSAPPPPAPDARTHPTGVQPTDSLTQSTDDRALAPRTHHAAESFEAPQLSWSRDNRSDGNSIEPDQRRDAQAPSGPSLDGCSEFAWKEHDSTQPALGAQPEPSASVRATDLRAAIPPEAATFAATPRPPANESAGPGSASVRPMRNARAQADAPARRSFHLAVTEDQTVRAAIRTQDLAPHEAHEAALALAQQLLSEGFTRAHVYLNGAQARATSKTAGYAAVPPPVAPRNPKD